MPPAAEPTGSLDTALAHTRRLLASRPELAVQQAREILQVVPGHPLATLLLGMALGATGQGTAATAALRRAVALEPHLPEAWRAEAWRSLGDQLTLAGDAAGADLAYARHIQAATRDPRLLRAAGALVDGQIPLAERLLRTHLKEHPTDVPAIRMLAEVAARLGRNADAEVLLTRCLELAPSFAAARHQYAIVLHRQNKSAAALAQISRLTELDPQNPTYRNLRAVVLTKIGEYRESIDIYAQVLEVEPGHAKIWLSYGHALATAGREADSIAAYRRARELAPHLGEACWSLANLKTYRFGAEEIDAMRGQLARTDLAEEDRLHVEFALGKALEDLAQYPQSFAHYRAGNALRRSRLDYDPAETTDFVRRSKELFTAEFFAARRDHGAPAADPIFIVGLPRSGSTLIEQMLASHSRVEGTMELPDILMMAANLGGLRAPSGERRYPGMVASLGPHESRELGEQYLASTRIQRKTGRPLFIDKMPNNFLHAGLIHLMLPNARIIDARRHPMACGFSAFKQHFAQGQSYTYDLAELGRYYRDYVDLMDHFDRVLPGRIHRVHHERLVDDSEGELRRLLAHCGLPFESACLRFHENERPVRTASAQQVRRPLSREGLEQWRHYEAWLAPLRDALGDLLEARGAAPS